MEETLKAQKYVDADADHYDLLFDSPDWVAEQKFDGVRCMIHRSDGEVFFTQGSTQLKFAAAAQWLDALREDIEAFGLPNNFVMDGELMIEDGTYHPFDLPLLRVGQDIRPFLCVTPDSPLSARRKALRAVCRDWPHTPAFQARTPAEKRALWRAAQEGGHEGIVMKRTDARYHAGERTLHVLKMKITHAIDCVVLTRNTDGCNATLGLWDGEAWQTVARSSMIGREQIGVGSVVEVKFMTIRDPGNPVLLQPRVVRERHDKAATDCSIKQIDGTYSNKGVIVYSR